MELEKLTDISCTTRLNRLDQDDVVYEATMLFLRSINIERYDLCTVCFNRIIFDDHTVDMLEHYIKNILIKDLNEIQCGWLLKLLTRAHSYEKQPLYLYIGRLSSHFDLYMRFLDEIEYEMPVMTILNMLMKSGHYHTLVKFIKRYSIDKMFDKLGDIPIDVSIEGDKSYSRFYTHNILQWIIDYNCAEFKSILEEEFGFIDETIWLYDDFIPRQHESEWYKKMWDIHKYWKRPTVWMNMREKVVWRLRHRCTIVIEDEYWKYFLTHSIPTEYMCYVSCPAVGLI